MRLLKLLKPSAVKKGIRYLRLLGLRLLIHAVMEKLRGRRLFFYNEEQLIEDSKTSDSQGKSTIYDIKPIQTEDYKVSIIIPSDNLDNISKCVESLIKSTTYPNYEIVVVTNSKTAEQLAKFRIPNSEFRIHLFDKPFNFSEKCNEGAAVATGNVLCFYNDDITPMDQDWIEQMLQALVLPEVGGVTPLQMMDDVHVLTAGNVLGTPGLQTFAFPFARYTPPRRLKPNRFIMRDVSVLSGACMLVKKDIFGEVGMFNAENTPNSFSDTEISLKIRDAGYRCVITPNTRVLHENKNTWRKTEKQDKSFPYMIEKWGKYFAEDIFFTDEMKARYKIGPPSHIYKYHAPENMTPRKSNGRDILFVGHDLLRTGAPTVLMDMVKVVTENGDRPVVVSLVDGPLRQEYLDMGITVIIDNSICDLTEGSAFAFEYVARNFDIIIVNTLACWRVIEVLSDSLPPVLWWIHESPYLIDIFRDSLPDKVADNIRAYAISKYCENSLREAGLSYASRILSSGISDYSANVTQVNHSETTNFLMIGAFETNKAHDVLIDAFGHIDRDVLNRAKFIFIGTISEANTHEMCLIAKEKYGNIEIHNSMPREDLREWYEKADCLLIPSRGETLSLVGLEATMFSLPMISSDKVGLSEYITHNENGLIFPSENSKALAELITYAVNNRDKMAEMGKRARKEIYEEHFTMSRFKENVLQAIEECLKWNSNIK